MTLASVLEVSNVHPAGWQTSITIRSVPQIVSLVLVLLFCLHSSFNLVYSFQFTFIRSNSHPHDLYTILTRFWYVLSHWIFHFNLVDCTFTSQIFIQRIGKTWLPCRLSKSYSSAFDSQSFELISNNGLVPCRQSMLFRMLADTEQRRLNETFNNQSPSQIILFSSTWGSNLGKQVETVDIFVWLPWASISIRHGTNESPAMGQKGTASTIDITISRLICTYL